MLYIDIMPGEPEELRLSRNLLERIMMASDTCEFCGDKQTHPLRVTDGKLMCRICYLYRLVDQLSERLEAITQKVVRSERTL